MRNKKINGNDFTPAEIEAVWKKGKVIFGSDSNVFRKDTCEAVIKRTEYGNTNSRNGWEIDHILPVTKGGTTDDLINLQPLQWENNRHKGDDYPDWTCKNRS